MTDIADGGLSTEAPASGGSLVNPPPVSLDEKDIASREFHDGRFLDISHASEITEAAPTQMIILAGPSASGKTTLLASLYEKFCEGGLAGYSFSGSRTLVGFEERCHLSRVESGRLNPETERTKAKAGTDFLHLRVAREASAEKHVNILFTDVAGESFRIIKDSTDECKKMTILSRADHFTVLVDGSQLVNETLRHVAYSDCRSLLRSTLDAGMLGMHSCVEVVFSKWDLIEPQRKTNEHTEFIEHIKAELTSEFGEAYGVLQFYKIASRPKILKEYEFGYNLDKLFLFWAESTPEQAHSTRILEKDTSALREIDRYASGESNKGTDS